jgi:hypothetical protein
MEITDLINGKNEKFKVYHKKTYFKVNPTIYKVAFYEADNEEYAWITLFMAVQKSPEFHIKETS